jgi:iron(III) transport system ATP-binding protein
MGEIRLEGIGLRYAGNGVPAVTDLSLTVPDGSFVTLVGPSGCGKTTTLRLLAGFLKPDTGRILVDGHVLSDQHAVTPPERRGMGMVFQQYAVWPHMTVHANVAFGLRARRTPRGVIDERVQAMLALVSLEAHASSYPAQLSGGQQQRVALARALVMEPRVLLLDEPLSNLDAKLRERMRWELKSIQRRTGITFVYVTHDQSEAMAIADYVAVLHEGRLQQYGPPREVYSNPANRFVADFMGAVNLVSADVLRTEADGSTCVRLLNRPRLELAINLARPMRRGERITLAVRPEDISLASTSDDGSSAALAGHVDQATFLGNLNDYLVSIAGEGPAAPLVLRVQSPAHQVVAENTPVSVTFRPERCVVVGLESPATDATGGY